MQSASDNVAAVLLAPFIRGSLSIGKPNDACAHTETILPGYLAPVSRCNIRAQYRRRPVQQVSPSRAEPSVSLLRVALARLEIGHRDTVGSHDYSLRTVSVRGWHKSCEQPRGGTPARISRHQNDISLIRESGDGPEDDVDVRGHQRGTKYTEARGASRAQKRSFLSRALST